MWHLLYAIQKYVYIKKKFHNYHKLLSQKQAGRPHCGLFMETARTWDGTGFSSGSVELYTHPMFIEPDYSGPFGVLWVHMT